MEIAVMDRSFTPTSNPDEYIYKSETKTTGLVALFHKDHIIEESKLRINNNSLNAIDYSYKRTGGKKKRIINVKFDWDNRLIINKVNDTTQEFPLENNTLDKLMYQYVVMRDLQKGNLPVSYSIVDGRKISNYRFELHGEEKLVTPIGEFNTIKIVRKKQGSENKTYLWCAPDLQFLPVKVINIEKDSWTTTAIIVSVSGLGK